MSEFAIWNELGSIYVKIGAYDEAIAVYLRAIELAPLFGWSYSNLAVAYCHKGKLSEAIPLYQKGIELLKNNKEKAILWNKLGDAYRRLDDYNKAMTAYQRADELEAALAPPEDDPAGIRRGLAGMPEAAAESQEVKEKEAASDSGGAGGSETSQAAVPSGELVNWLRELLDNAPSGTEEESPSATSAGEAAITRASQDEANGWIPEADSPTMRKSRLLKEMVNPIPPTGGARPVGQPITIQAVLELEQTSPAAFLATEVAPRVSITDAEAEERRPSSPADQMPVEEGSPEEASAPAPEQASDNNEKSALNPHLSNFHKNVAVYKKITDINPTNDRAWDTLGLSLKALGNYDEAISAFERAIALAPAREVYHYHLGLVYAAQKRHAEAIDAFRKVIELNPEYILAHGALAGSCRRLGQDDEAAQHIQIALPMMQAENEYNRACFEAICGNTDEAIELLGLAMEKKQTTLEWIHCDADLDFIRDDPRFETLVGQAS